MTRKRRQSPRRPAPTIRQFAQAVGTTEAIMRSLVPSGEIKTVKCNGVQLIPPAAQAHYRELYGAPPASDTGDATASRQHQREQAI